MMGTERMKASGIMLALLLSCSLPSSGQAVTVKPVGQGYSEADSVRADSLSADDEEQTCHNLPDVTVTAKRKKPESAKEKAARIERQLLGIQKSDMDFKPIGLVKFIVSLFRKKPKEKKEKLERILREYDKVKIESNDF